MVKTFCLFSRLWCQVTNKEKEPKTDVDRMIDRMDQFQTKVNIISTIPFAIPLVPLSVLNPIPSFFPQV